MSYYISLVNFYFIDNIFISFVNIYRENDNNDKNSSHDFFHDNFNHENSENYDDFKFFETKNHC